MSVLAVLFILLPVLESLDARQGVPAHGLTPLRNCCAPGPINRLQNETIITKQPVPPWVFARKARAAPIVGTTPATPARARGAGHGLMPPEGAAEGFPAQPPAMRTLAIPSPRAARILLPLENDTAGPGGAPQSATGGEMDARSVRSALAAIILGTVADRARPSRLLGDAASGSPLAGTLDGFWGLGQQAALNFLVEGKGPGRRQIAHDAVRIIAAAANQQVASLMDDATRYGADNGIRFLRNLEVMADWYPGNRLAIEARTIDALFESAALEHTVFLQAAIRSDLEDTTANIGLGYRYLPPGSRWMLGVNAFYDREFPIGHERMSIGLEASHGDFTLFGNRYVALSGWTGLNDSFDERPLSGWDAGIAGQVPGLEDLTVTLAAFRWERETEKDKTGLRFTADYSVSPDLQLGATVSADDGGGVKAGFRLTYQFGADHFGGGEAAAGPGRDHRLDFVNRENRIHTEKRAVPKGYAVQFLASNVNMANQSSLGFILTGPPLSSRYRYEITSSAGGVPVTGGGRVESDPQPITGIDVSGLPDGMLTLAIQVISREGASGPRVTAQIVKSTEGLSVSVTSAAPSPTNASPIPFTISFSQPVSGFDLTDISVTNGTAANLQTSDNATWTVDVTPEGQGAVELQLPAGVATASSGVASAASNATRVVYDSAAPAGYSVAFLAGPLTSANFEIIGAEQGSFYSFIISSSGGGEPVTGSGTIGAGAQQVSGLDLSGLADGTLTLTVTLADPLGNAGSPATGAMAKDASAPVIIAITPPSAGDYDDL